MRALAHHAGIKAQLALSGETVMYARGDGFNFDRLAIQGSTPFKEESHEHGARVVRSVDWIVDYCEWPPKMPVEGETLDYIEEAPRRRRITYRVTSFNGEPCYRVDPTRTRLRIHTTEHSSRDI